MIANIWPGSGRFKNDERERGREREREREREITMLQGRKVNQSHEISDRAALSCFSRWEVGVLSCD
jgi:hypothetical protein